MPLQANPTRRRAGRLAAAGTLIASMSLASLVGAASPASAHARCDGVSHYDWHTIALHYDYHRFTRYEYSNHYHWWSGSNHTHKHVRFRNSTHGYDYFKANC